MDEGWTRFVLDTFDFPYTTVHDAEVRAGDLRDRFDTILIPSISAKTIREGNAPAQTRSRPTSAASGGMGPSRSGRSSAAGGTLVCLENACQFAIEELALPVVDVLQGVKPKDFYSPGSIFRVEQQTPPAGPKDPILAGMPADFAAWFDNSQAFKVTSPGAVVLAHYAERNTLDSGWLLGAEKIQGKGALVVAPFEKGSVVLFGFSPHHRGQPVGTFRLLFNGLYPR